MFYVPVFIAIRGGGFGPRKITSAVLDNKMFPFFFAATVLLLVCQ